MTTCVLHSYCLHRITPAASEGKAQNCPTPPAMGFPTMIPRENGETREMGGNWRGGDWKWGKGIGNLGGTGEHVETSGKLEGQPANTQPLCG